MINWIIIGPKAIEGSLTRSLKRVGSKAEGEDF